MQRKFRPADTGACRSYRTKDEKIGNPAPWNRGRTSGSWILMDYGDVIMHIFYKPVREFYDIEGLWSDAPVMTIGESVRKLTVLNDDM